MAEEMQRGDGLEEELRRAQARIAQQDAELASLRQSRSDEARLAAELRRLVLSAGVARELSPAPEPESLLESLVDTAARALGARAASLLAVDQSAGGLVFRAATGSQAEAVRQFVVPFGRGIAGFVAETGQPMAVANVREDPRFYREIGERIDYIPESILCVPLQRNDAVVGVLELLDAASGSFGTDAIEIAGRFAQQAVALLDQSQSADDLASLIVDGLRRLGVSESAPPALEAEIDAFARHAGAGDRQREALALARAIAGIAAEGEEELALIRDWIGSFLQYLRSRAALRYP